MYFVANYAYDCNLLGMASGQKKIYIAKDGEILYGEQRDEYLLNASDEDEFANSSEMYIKGGNILRGREAIKEKVADDVRDAVKKSGISKWLDKLENEAKEKKKEKQRQPVGASKESETASAETLVPSKVQNSAIGKTVKTAKDVCKKYNYIEHSDSSTEVVENVAREIHKKLPPKVKSVTGRGLEVAKNTWKTGQDVIKTATEAGIVIKDVLTGDDVPEINVSGNADFTGNIQGHATLMQKGSNRVRAEEAQLQLKGHLHAGPQFTGAMNGKTVNVEGDFDADISANAEMVGADIQIGDGTDKEVHKVSATKQKTTAVESTNKNKKTNKVRTRFEGQANASAKGVNVKVNTHRRDETHEPVEVPDIKINATAQAQATGINVDINTSRKPRLNNESSDKKGHPKLTIQGTASASATGADVKIGNKITVGEQSDLKTLEAHVHAEAKGCELQIGNRYEKPKFKGGSASAKVQATGAAARLGNIYRSDSEMGVGAMAEARVAGAELNVANVNLDKGSSSGVAVVKEVKPGLTAFNVQAGMGGKAGIKVSTDMQFGNISCNLGPPNINISPFAFNLGFGGGIKGSAATATKGSNGSDGKGDGRSSDGHKDNKSGKYTSNGSGGASNASSGAAASDNYYSNTSGYVSNGSTGNSGYNIARSYDMRGSRSQISMGGNCSENNSSNIGNTQYSQNSSTLGSKASRGDYVKGNSFKSTATDEPGNSAEFSGGSYTSNNPHTTGDEGGSVIYQQGSSHSASQFAYRSMSHDPSTMNHNYSGSEQHGKFNYKVTGHYTGSNGNTRSSFSQGTSHLNDYGTHGSARHANNSKNFIGENASRVVDPRISKSNKSANTDTDQGANTKSKSNDSAYAAAGQGPKSKSNDSVYAVVDQSTNRKSSSVNTNHSILSTDNQTTQGDVENATLHNPHRLPRKLNEDSKLQTNVATTSRKYSSQGYHTRSSQHEKYSGVTGNGLFAHDTHSTTHGDAQSAKNNDADDELSKKVSHMLSRNETSTKKIEKSEKSASREESKQKLTEKLIKLREKYEAENVGKSTSNSSSADEDKATKEAITTSTQSKKSSGVKTKSDSTDQQDTDNVEEVPIPDEKKKPFGTNNNIFTMDCIRKSSYRVQTSNKKLQKIGSNVMGFK